MASCFFNVKKQVKPEFTDLTHKPKFTDLAHKPKTT